MDEWILTDDDCLQYRKRIADRVYHFIQTIWLDTCEGDQGYPDKSWTVMEMVVNLNDYSNYDMECAICSYYDSITEIQKTYGSDSESIIAECIFEEATDENATTYGMMTKEEAEKFVRNFISERKKYVVVTYKKTGANKGNRDTHKYFDDLEDARKYYTALYKRELGALNPTVHEWIVDEDYTDGGYYKYLFG